MPASIKFILMKKVNLFLGISALLLAVTIISCDKKGSDDDATNFDEEAAAQSDDQYSFSSQIDAVAADANLVISTNGSLTGREHDVVAGLCNATFTANTAGDPKTVTITYNGANCINTYSRTGTVTVSMPANTTWKTAGAVVTVTYNNLVVTRTIDSKSITINGSHTITNVSGGLLVNLANGPITHSVTSQGISVKFGNETARTWKVSRQQVYSYNNGIVLTISGTHTEGNVTGIAEWGTNRFGREFTSVISEPLVFRQDCNFRLTAGQVKHTVPVFNATATFGLDTNGESASCPGLGAYYCKINWTGPNNNSHTVIFPY
jgi:hypothetical protein